MTLKLKRCDFVNLKSFYLTEYILIEYALSNLIYYPRPRKSVHRLKHIQSTLYHNFIIFQLN